MHVNKPIPNTDNYWTLLLDRDGVINHQKEDSYILHPSEFVFLPDVLSSLAQLAELFSLITLITNQRGVGKGLMTEANLHEIHGFMLEKTRAAGGRIDGIYYCTDVHMDSPCRKPNIGMAEQVKRDFPNCDFAQSIMIGNSMSDMQFGRNIGAYTIFITSTHPLVNKEDSTIDAVFDSLASATKALLNARSVNRKNK